MSDGSINIDTKIDDSGLDKGLSNISTKLKSAGKITDDYLGKIAKFSVLGAGAAVALDKVKNVVSDLTEKYKTQIKAETQLESAAKNNPYLDSTGVAALKEYASQIQSYTTYGDEELIPMMAKLVAAGRTQDEVMQIMSTSVDMAASGTTSLDSAVTTLNKSYGGLAGELGESIPEIKSMTAEQLKNGGAVKLLGERYKGIAEQVAKTTGTAESLGNAFGDLKEELGAPFEKNAAPVRTFFTTIISGWANSLKAKREYAAATDANAVIEKRTASTLATQLATERDKLSVMQSQHAQSLSLLSLSDEELGKRYGSRDAVARLIAVEAVELDDQRRLVLLLSSQEAVERSKETAAKSTAQQMAEQVAREKEASDYIEANRTEREKALQQLDLQAQAEGRSVTAEEKLAVYAQSYVDLVGNSNGLVSAQNSAAVKLLATTKGISEEVERQNELKKEGAELESKIKEILDGISVNDNRPESEKMKELKNNLDEYYAQMLANEQIASDKKWEISKEYSEKRKELEKEITEAEKNEEAQRVAATISGAEKKLQIANEFVSQYASMISSITSMVSEQIKNELTVKEAELKKQYANGEISAEEYEAAVTEAKKQAAKEQYNIDMWSWSASILTATANTALGATQALAQGGAWTGPLLAALVVAAGAAQLASIIANKPVPPSFATGGIVGGTSYTGDSVQALVNSREMLLNAGQQRNLFDAINSNSIGGGNTTVQVYNSAANDVKATPQVTEDGIKILIEKTVSAQMADGRFNNSFRTMQSNIRGVRYTN